MASTMLKALSCVEDLYLTAKRETPEKCLPLGSMAQVYGLALHDVRCTLYGMTLEYEQSLPQIVGVSHRSTPAFVS